MQVYIPRVPSRDFPNYHEDEDDNEDASTYITTCICSDQAIFYLSLSLGREIDEYQEMSHEFIGRVTFIYNFPMHLSILSECCHTHILFLLLTEIILHLYGSPYLLEKEAEKQL